MPSPRIILETCLTKLASLHHRVGVYRGPADFVLRHGRWYTPRPLPDNIESATPKMCYGNAIAVAVKHDLKYVEGYALLPPPYRMDYPILHAWNADADGNVVDVTFASIPEIQCGAAYLGVEFSVERADDATWNGDACILDDWKRQWPLFQQTWKSEDYSLTWPPSYRLDMMREAVRAGNNDVGEELLRRMRSDMTPEELADTDRKADFGRAIKALSDISRKE